MTMRLAARACVPLESTARCLIMSRGVGAHALYEKGSKDFCGGFRQIHRLLRKSPGTNALCTRPGLVAESLKAFGQSQSRPFRKANYADKSHGKEKTEEILEALEVRDGEKDTQPTWNAQDQKPSGKQGSDWPDEMTKGKLLTTPSHLFKLIIPLTTVGKQGQDKGIERIAILVHPQQPLSYLERLIQSELPPIHGQTDKPRPPAVSFIALQHEDNAIKPRKRIEDDLIHDTPTQEAPQPDVVEKHHPGPGKPEKRRRSREEDAEIYSYPRKTGSGLDRPQGEPDRFVRWSQATEVGDFIRDAARAQEFIITIEGAPSGLGQIRVGVPSFHERTYFLRIRLRKLSRQIQGIAKIKHECDELAHRGAQRVAMGGFGILAAWWYMVYKLTFETDLGWDTMEPVTYLVSLSTLMAGYLWFLYHNREISYKSALDFTVSARQRKLYQQHNIDLQLWESLIGEGKTLRREIKGIAAEYDVEWDERADEQDERVTEALRSERGEKKGKKRRGKDGEEQEEED